mmetsp:Transcript_23082/g.20495  ORF Transcript_23082/g.20495 Transcript_23082/m.20495 type:complete len:86 (+) Transcript_23082:153-410(+)
MSLNHVEDPSNIFSSPISTMTKKEEHKILMKQEKNSPKTVCYNTKGDFSPFTIVEKRKDESWTDKWELFKQLNSTKVLKELNSDK